MPPRTPYSLIALLLMVAPALGQPNWPQFRGPGATGVSRERGLPDSWTTEKNVSWKVEIPGRGWSSPVVWGDRVFLTSVVREGKYEDARKGLYFGGERLKPATDLHRWMVYCLDINTGKTLWEREAHAGPPDGTIHIKNSYASETPIVDGERLYVYFGNLGLFCYTLDGKPLWEKKLGSFKTRFGWGTAASPVLHGGRLYVVNDNEENSFLVALDARDGKEIWRVERDEKSNWSTPFVWETEGRTEIVTPGTNRVRSYDLEGKLLWELKGMSSITIATPYARHGMLFVSSGYVLDPRRPLYAILPNAQGDISLKAGQKSNEAIAWCQPTGAPYNPTTLVYGEYLYVLHDRGFLSCYEARTGKPVYERERLRAGVSGFTASPWAYEDKIFCLSEDGDTFVVQAGPTYKLLQTNPLDEMCMATPAVAQGSVLIRTLTRLYRIRSAPKK